MKTIRFKDKIFTANYIESISEIEEYLPDNTPDTFSEFTNKLVGNKKDLPKFPYVKFTIGLISGEKHTKVIFPNNLPKEDLDELNIAINKINEDFKIQDLIDLKKLKGEIIKEQQYEKAAALRDDEKKLVDNLDSEGYHNEMREKVHKLAIKKMRALAEEKRNYLESIVKETKAPIEI